MGYQNICSLSRSGEYPDLTCSLRACVFRQCSHSRCLDSPNWRFHHSDSNARIARSNQLQQQELETGRARAARFQAYLEQMGTLLVDHHLAASNPNSRANALSTVDWAKNLIGQRLLNLNAYDDVNNARVVAQAQTLAVLERVW